MQEYFRGGRRGVINRRDVASSERNSARHSQSGGRGEAEARKATRRKLSLSGPLFPASRSTRRERSLMQLQLRATFILVSRESISLHPPPFLPPPPPPSLPLPLSSSSFSSSSFLFGFFVSRFASRLVLARGSPSLALAGGSFHPRLRTLGLNDALRVFKQKFHFIETVISESLSGGGVFSPRVARENDGKSAMKKSVNETRGERIV